MYSCHCLLVIVYFVHFAFVCSSVCFYAYCLSLCSTIGLENEKKQLTKECNSLKQNLHQVHLEVEMLQARLTAVQNIDEKVHIFPAHENITF